MLCVKPSVSQVTIWALVCFYYQWQILTLFKFELWLLISQSKSYIDLFLIRHWYLDQEHRNMLWGLTSISVFEIKSNLQLSWRLHVFSCLLRRLACSKIVTKCYYFWHKSRGSRAFNCDSQEKEDKHSSFKSGTWIGRRGSQRMGKCADVFLESMTKYSQKFSINFEINALVSQTRFGWVRQISDSFWSDSFSRMTKP